MAAAGASRLTWGDGEVAGGPRPNLPPGPRSVWRLAPPGVPSSVPTVALVLPRVRPTTGWSIARRRRGCTAGSSGRSSGGAYRNKTGSTGLHADRLSAIGRESRATIGGTAGAGSTEGWPSRSPTGVGGDPVAKKPGAHTPACDTRQFSCACVLYALQMSSAEPRMCTCPRRKRSCAGNPWPCALPACR